jgi:GNAT superfamily N-acetyltransferase
MSDPFVVRVTDAATLQRARPQLSRLLVDGFEAGAALGFAPPLTELSLASYWSSVADDVAAGLRHVLVAAAGDDLVGTAQLVPDRAPNGCHRGEVRALAVRATARRQGVAAKLMSAVETLAAEVGLSLLQLTTHVGLTAAGVYRRLGWTELGVIPGYAVAPDGRLVDNVFFWKHVGQPARSTPNDQARRPSTDRLSTTDRLRRRGEVEPNRPARRTGRPRGPRVVHRERQRPTPRPRRPDRGPGPRRGSHRQARTRYPRRSAMNPRRPRTISSPLKAGNAPITTTRTTRNHH